MAVDQFLTINGAQIKYSEYGEGFAVVFVHAGIADSRMWDDQIGAFSKDYRIVTYDMRGFGQSKPVAGEFSHYADLLGLLDALEIECCVLVGCSRGGGIIMDAALAAPERVLGLVNVAGIVHGLDVGDTIEFVEPEQWEETVAAFKAGDLKKANELEVQMWVDGFNQPVGRGPTAVREKVREMNAIVLQNETDGLKMQETVLQPKAGIRLGEISQPTLFISGSLDEPFLPDIYKVLRAEMSDSRHEHIEGVAHLPNMEVPEKFNKLVLDFVGEVQMID